MNTTGKFIPAGGGVLGQYVESIRALHGHLRRISDNKYEIAASLSRAAAALRSVAEPLPGRRKGC